MGGFVVTCEAAGGPMRSLLTGKCPHWFLHNPLGQGLSCPFVPAQKGVPYPRVPTCGSEGLKYVSDTVTGEFLRDVPLGVACSPPWPSLLAALLIPPSSDRLPLLFSVAAVCSLAFFRPLRRRSSSFIQVEVSVFFGLLFLLWGKLGKKKRILWYK